MDSPLPGADTRARFSPTARVLAPVLVLVVGLGATAAGWLLDHQRTTELRDTAVEGTADGFVTALSGELDRYADAARAMRTVFEGGAPEDAQYARAAESLDLDRRYPAITGLNAVLPDGPGLSGAWTVSYVAPRGPNRAALGFDIRDNPLAEEAAQRAADTGVASMTRPITLAQETGSALGFVIYVPFYDTEARLGSVAQRRAAFRGWTQAVFRGPDLVDSVSALANGLHVTITAEAADGTPVVFNEMGAEPIADGTVRQVERYGRTWELTLQPTAAFAAATSRGLGAIILALGLPVTALLTLLILALARSDALAAEIIAQRTAELRRREQRFRTLTATSPTGTFELDASGAPSYANAQLTSMLGWRSDDSRSAWRQTIHDDDVPGFEAAWQELLTRDRPVAVSVRVHGSDASLHHVRLRIVPLHDEDARIGFIGTVEDLSAEVAAQERAERALGQARTRAGELAGLNDQLEEAITTLTRTVNERDELMAVVAHDVRGPLTVINGFAQTIAKLDGPRLSEPSRDFLDRIQRQTRELESLVDDLVLGSRLGADAVTAEPAAIDVDELVHELAQEVVGDAATVEVVGRPVALADPRHIRRILTNLLSNARKYGRPPIEVRAVERDHLVELSVTDHGPGVPAAVARRLFQRFAGGDAADVDPGSGAGLGLSIVADLVQLNGGAVRHEPVEGGGARFTVTLPSTRVEARQQDGT